MNESKIGDSRMWQRWKESGAVGTSEALSQKKLPTGLTYFKIMDSLLAIKTISPDNNGYLAINFYAKGEDSPRVKILRLVSRYKDDNTGLQDEIWIGEAASGIQLNAERNHENDYVDYPKMTNPDSLKYLEKAIKTISDLVSKEDSHVRINNEKAAISHHGNWIPAPSEPTAILPVPNITLNTLPPDERERIEKILERYEGKDLKHPYLINEAVRLALAHAKDHPLKVGDIVAYPKDQTIYQLRRIDQATRTAHVGYLDKKTRIDAITTFPLDEIFDVSVCNNIALTLRIKEIEDNAPLN